jgi:hypothetical protein
MAQKIECAAPRNKNVDACPLAEPRLWASHAEVKRGDKNTMTYDPYQTHPAVGTLSGLMNPLASLYAVMQASAINPAIAYSPLAATAGLNGGLQGAVGQQPGLPGYTGTQGLQGIPTYGGISPQQSQLATALASQSSQLLGQSPFANVWQSPFMSNPYQNPLAAVQNPLVAAALQNQIIQSQLQNQLATVAQQNPILAAQLAANLGQIGFAQQPLGFGQTGFGQTGFPQPYFHPHHQMGHVASLLGQQQTPFLQLTNPLAQPTLAPQSWVGQSQQGQINPLLLQSVARGIQGITPWGAF